ncbi:MAG: peptide ABC transporter substrate-binding protein [Candidatus Eremiobacteraeota bacterium]|nr:peptide ABC transporter substrate-binding protein [Candidatus Eremiobacteraeota bacterium]
MLVCGWIAAPAGLNPLTSVSSASTMTEDLIYSRVVELGADMLPRWPTSFASKIDVGEGGKRYVLHVRRNARWPDGVPITADDVVFSIALTANPVLFAGRSSDFALMTSVRKTAPYTVEIRLKSPSPPFLVNALSEAYILPKHILGKFPAGSPEEAKFVNADAAFAQHPMESGAFRIERTVPDSYMVLAPNPVYWGPKPHLQKIAFRVYPQQDSLYAAVDAGEVDVTDIPPNLWRVHARLRGEHKAVTWPWNVTFLLLPNFRDPNIPFIHERAVRQAMLYAIDRKFIVRGIMSGQADILNGPIPSFSPYYDPKVMKYPYDPARARALLDANGWKMRDGVRTKNGKALRFTLKTGGASDAVASNVAELVQADLRAVGIDCTLDNEEIQTFFADLHASKFQIALRGVILNAYPDDYQTYDSSQTHANGGYNIGFYDNPQVDRAIVAARTAANPRAARVALNRYQELAAQDLPGMFLFSNRLGAILPKGLSGYDLTPIAPAALPMGLQFWRLRK